MWKSRIHGFNPCINPCFPCVDFLSAADKTNDDRPIRMAIHTRDQKLWLGLGEPGAMLFSPHKVRGLLQIPGALRLIKNCNMLCRGPCVNQQVVAKMMNVLHERFYTFSDLPLAYSIAATFLACNFIAC